MVTCTRPSASVGAAEPIVIHVGSPDSVGIISNTASVEADTGDSDLSNNTVVEYTTVTAHADLSVDIEDSPDPVAPGAPLSYTITVSNPGPSEAESITMTDSLPYSVEFVGASGSGWSCSDDEGIVTCTRPTLGVDSDAVVTVNVTAPTELGTFSNYVSVHAATPDLKLSNNGDTELTMVSGGVSQSRAADEFLRELGEVPIHRYGPHEPPQPGDTACAPTAFVAARSPLRRLESSFPGPDSAGS